TSMHTPRTPWKPPTHPPTRHTFPTETPETPCTSSPGPTGASVSCTEEGFFPDKRDCRKFYRCVSSGSSFTKYELECGPGSGWDSVLQSCNHEYLVPRCNKDSSQPDSAGTTVSDSSGNGVGGSTVLPGTAPSEASISSTLSASGTVSAALSTTPSSVISTVGVATSLTSTSTLSTSSDNGVGTVSTSETASSSSAVLTSTVASQSTSSSVTESVLYLPHDSSAASSVSTNTVISSSPGISQCTEEGFFPDPEDCRKFYRCVGSDSSFTKYEFQCGTGTAWDSGLQSCNHEYLVPNCKGGTTSSDSFSTIEADSSQNEITSTISQQTITQAQTSVPPSSTAASTSTVRPSTITSSSGPATSTSTVTSPSNSTTVPSSTTSIVETSTVSSQTTPSGVTESVSYLPPESSTGSSVSTTTIVSTSPGSSQCTEEGFFPDPQNCHKFYRCVGSDSSFTKYEFQCGTGTAWDSSLQSCNHEYLVPNCKGGTTSSDSSSTIEADSSQNEITSTISQQTITQAQTSVPPSSTAASTSTVRPSTITSSSGPATSTSTVTSPSNSTTVPSSTTSIVETSTVSSQTTPSGVTESVSYLPPESSTGSSVSTTTIVSTSPGSSQCTEEGFFPDPQNCHKFYRCVGSDSSFTKYEFQCGTGTAWDSSLQSCNHEYLVPNCKGGTTSSDSSSTIEADSSQNEITSTISQQTITQAQTSVPPSSTAASTSTVRPSTITSSSGPATSTSTVTSPSNSTTVPSSTTSIVETSTVSSQTTPSGVTESVSYLPPESSTGSSVSTTTIVSTSPGSSQCTEEGFFPDPQNCHKFYRCVGSDSSFTKYEFQCGTGTAWDSSLQSCNHEYLVPNCKGGTTASDSSSTTETDSSQNEITSTISVTESVSYLPPESSTGSSVSTTTIVSTSPGSSQCTEEGFFPDPQNCHKFYRCVGSDSSFTKYEFQCGTGTAWDSSLQSCNHEYLVPNCKGGTTSSDSSSTTETDSSQNEITSTISVTESVSYLPPESSTGSSVSTTTIVSTSPGSSQCTEEGFFPDPQNCHKFYRCVGSDSSFTKYEFQCGTGTAWDSSLQSCNHEYLVPNCKGGTTSSDSSSTTEADSSQNEITSTISQQTTTQAQTSVPPSSTAASTSTVPSSTTPGTSTSSGSSQCPGEGFFPNPTDCTKFFRCVRTYSGFIRYDFACGPGTAWDSSIQSCNHKSHVASCSSTNGATVSQGSTGTPSSHSTRPSSNTTATPTTGTSITPSSTGSSSTSSNSTSSTEPNVSDCATKKPNNTIVCEKEGFYPHPTKCNKFYRCVDNGNGLNVYHFECGPGTIFDPSINICNHPESVYPPRDCMMPTSTPSTTSEVKSTSETTTESTTEATTESTSEATTESTSEATTESQGTTTTSPRPTVPATCPIGNLTDEQIALVCPTGFKRHPKYCNLFYQCTIESNEMDIKVLILSCPVNTIFDEEKLQCLPENESSHVCTGTITTGRFYRKLLESSVSPVKVPSGTLCPGEGHYPYKLGCSTTFYKCERDSRKNLQGYLYKCPPNYLYWSISRRCERAIRLPMCAHVALKGLWDKRWQIPIEDTNVSARSLFVS
ncbi:hypothetical protein WH47_00372, partial [Habropoda laboriosa]